MCKNVYIVMPEMSLFVIFLIKYGAIIGLIVVTTLIINLHFLGFKSVFKTKTVTYWWLFSMIIIIPLMLFLYIFSLLFTPSEANPEGNPIVNSRLILKRLFFQPKNTYYYY